MKFHVRPNHARAHRLGDSSGSGTRDRRGAGTAAGSQSPHCQRYIARLQDLCIPVESTRGVGGAYRLKPGFRLPPMMFTDEEAFALTLGLRALRHLGLGAFAPAAEGAAAKLGRVLPNLVRAAPKR